MLDRINLLKLSYDTLKLNEVKIETTNNEAMSFVIFLSNIPKFVLLFISTQTTLKKLYDLIKIYIYKNTKKSIN